ncbi:MAG: NAD(P)/FAD-dependent oxidoreductase [Theionarchaea archaeon]|nr:NAD(P)/FAD-dependent oxidoreductase [Theionarchaea archaeon]
MMMEDVLVVGAGPAGSMASKTLAEQGYSVTCFEKGPLIREKPCGGGIPEIALKELSIDFTKGKSVYGISLCSPRNNVVNLSQPSRAGISMYRADFDYYLMQKAQKAGAKIRGHSTASPLSEKGILKGVRTGKDIHCAPLVIVCDGALSSFTRKMGLYVGGGDNQAAAFQYQMSMDDSLIEEKIGAVLELYFGNQWVPLGYTWVFPKPGGITVGNATWLSAMKARRVNLKALLNTFIHHHPVARKKLEGAEILYSQSHVLAFPGIVKSVYGDHFLIAGDAGGFTSYATGGGLYNALVSGKIAGEVAAEALKKGEFSKKFLKIYEKQINKKIGADLKWGRTLRKLFLNKDIEQELLVKSIMKNPWIRERTVLLLKEEIRYDAFLLNLILHPHHIIRSII